MGAEEATETEPRSIRFDMDKNQTLEFEKDYMDIVDDIWFSGDEYIRMKAKSREEARAWRRHGYGVLIKDAFATPQPNVQEYLNAFCQLEDELSRRGLERHLSRQHAEERSDHKDSARQAVFNTQDRLRQRGMKGDEMADRIFQAYSQQCRTAKVYARRMALADELVVKEGEDSTAAERIMDEEGGPNRHNKMERRLSNFSTVSTNSLDSRRRWVAQKARMGGGPLKSSRKCPSSPASPMEEYYAAIA